MMKPNYDVVIIGGGVQGLSLAYNLAKNGTGKIAVFEKSYLGSGASSRNGEMLRSAFASKEWIRFFDKSLQLWETLASELDFNVMYTRCGYLILASTPKEFELCCTNVETQQSFGLKTELLTSKDVRRLIPAINPEMAAGGILQKNGGFARHDAAVWAYARSAQRLKVDIFPFTEVMYAGCHTRYGKEICSAFPGAGWCPINAAVGRNSRYDTRCRPAAGSGKKS
ncbi:MAG: FAD-dependent oxidoreductase [Deltaproteobacteria bacterium]